MRTASVWSLRRIQKTARRHIRAREGDQITPRAPGPSAVRPLISASSYAHARIHALLTLRRPFCG
jgi:hypothetical protein